jgi:starch-binding outer membrane protein SusE/F
MKNNIIIKILAVVFSATFLFVSCTDEMSEVRLDPKLATTQTLDVTSNSAMVVGFVVADGQGFLQRGICFSTSPEPTINDGTSVYNNEGKTATFKVTLTGLDYATTYYARAYGKLRDETVVYGEQMTFTTLPVVPTVTTGEFEVTSFSTATGSGNVTNAGGADVTARGVVYGTVANPTLENSVATFGEGTGEFEAELTNLRGSTTYYVRAYATNSAGTGYGPEVSFITDDAPTVTLWVAGGFQGWSPENAKFSLMNSEDNRIVEGYVYFHEASDYKIVSQKNWNGPNYGKGDGDGKISDTGGDLNISEPGYYLFKVDLVQMTYTATKTEWGVIGDGTEGGWNSDQDMTYSTHFNRWFATIPLTANTIKFRANDGWDLNYGDTNQDGKLAEGEENIPVAAAGTYSIMLNLAQPLDYSYALTKWSLIGGAVGGWGAGDDVDMTPNANNTWSVTTDLDAGEMKFRANHDWAINLGGTPNDLSWDGPNINITEAGNYTVTLNLVNGSYTITKN